MPPSPRLYMAKVSDNTLTMSAGEWAKHLGFHHVSVRRHLKQADGDMNIVLKTIGANRPSLGGRHE